MKYIIAFFLSAILFTACQKEDNPKLPDLVRVPLPLITLDPSGDNAISPTTPETFLGKYVVDIYFKNDIKPQKFDIVIIKNGDHSTVKTLKEGVTIFPTSFELTGADIVSAFGAPSEGDSYDIGADVTTASGQKFEAFPLNATGYSSSIAGQPGSSTSIQYIVPCAFNKENFNGSYTVVQDDWADYDPGETVEVKPGAGENEISIAAYPSPAFGKNRKPMILTINPLSNDPTTYEGVIAEQVIGDYDGAPPGATARGTGSANPCGDRITMTVTINIGGDDYADNVLVLEK